MKKAILYTRTATEDESSKYRLAKQEFELRSYCIDNNISAIDCFSEICSGYNFNRPKWKQLVSYLRKNPGEIDLILVTNYDRLTRDIRKAYALMVRLKKMGVEIICSEFHIDFGNPNSKLELFHSMLIPEIESTNKSVRSKLSMSKHASSGYFMGMAPIGYKNCKTKNGQYNLVIDTETAPLIKNILLDFSKGKESIEKIKRKYSIEVEKFNLNTQKIKYILQNPTYAGKLRIRNNLGSGYKYVKAKHIAIVSNQTFTKNQILLNKK